MTKEKWEQIYSEEAQKHCYNWNNLSLNKVNPENWEEMRQACLEFVEAVDEATEVYNMENKRK